MKNKFKKGEEVTVLLYNINQVQDSSTGVMAKIVRVPKPDDKTYDVVVGASCLETTSSGFVTTQDLILLQHVEEKNLIKK